MPDDFMPLSGAILVTNPRKKVNTMAIALDNPNDRRRINKLARLVVKEGMSPKAAVALWEGEKSVPAKQRDPRLRRAAKSQNKAMWAAIERAPKLSKAQKAQRSDEYAKAKRAVAKEFAKLDGYATSERNVRGGVISTPYATRAVGSKAKRYYSHSKKNNRYQKGGPLGAYQTVNVSNIRKANKIRRKYFNEHGQGARSAHILQQFRSGQSTADMGYPLVDWNAKNWTKQAGGWGTSYKPSANSRKWINFLKSHKGSGLSMKQLGAKYRSGARSNPGVFGALALENPRIQGVQSAAMYAGTVAAGAAAGSYAIKWLNGNEMVADNLAKIPVISRWPYATTGILGGLVVGFAASRIGGGAGKALSLAAGGMIAAGGAIQVACGDTAFAAFADDFSDEELAMEEELGGFGALALDNEGVFGALALDNYGGVALDNYGDGMAYEIGPLTQDEFSQSYSGASLADAYFSGADMDVEEGQAMVEGPSSYQRKFGRAPKRIALHGGQRKGASHLAGRRGHRWGWLIKMLGSKNAQRIATMPPARRVVMIRKLRENAIKTFNQSLAKQEGAPEFRPEHVSGAVPQTANAPQGPCSSYGAMLFAGDDIL